MTSTVPLRAGLAGVAALAVVAVLVPGSVARAAGDPLPPVTVTEQDVAAAQARAAAAGREVEQVAARAAARRGARAP